MTVTAAERDLATSRTDLERFLAAASGATQTRIHDARPLSGGAIQENWLLDVDFADGPERGRRELVLRTDSPSAVAVSLSRAQEFALLQAAAAAGVTVPEPLWLCEDEAVIGKPFYVMRRAAGTAAGHEIVKDDGPGSDKEALAERLGEELAHIHSIQPPRDDLAFLEMPEDGPASAAIARYRAYLDAFDEPQPAIEWGLRWAELHAPPRGEIVLVHQDFRTGNYMVSNGALTAILDWEFCAWGDPLSDIGWFCAKCWRFGHSEREAGGIASRESFYKGYRHVSRREIEPEAVAFWELMAHIRWAIIALQQGERFLSGGEASLELALTGRLRPAELALEILSRTRPDAWQTP